VVINVALPYSGSSRSGCFLAAGVHYIDTANYEPRMWRSSNTTGSGPTRTSSKNAGLTALLGCGFDPGVTNVYTAYALKHHFSKIDTLDIIDCNAATMAGLLPPFQSEINLRESPRTAASWENGRWVETKPARDQAQLPVPRRDRPQEHLLPLP